MGNYGGVDLNGGGDPLLGTYGGGGGSDSYQNQPGTGGIL